MGITKASLAIKSCLSAYSIPTYGDSIYGDEGYGEFTGASVPLDEYGFDSYQ